jgi:hypothetical protein
VNMNILLKISLFALSATSCFASESKFPFQPLQVEENEAEKSPKQHVRKSSCCKKCKKCCDLSCNRPVAATWVWIAGFTILGLGTAFWLQDKYYGEELYQYEQVPEPGAVNCYGFRYGTGIQGKSDMRFCYSPYSSLGNVTTTLEESLNKINISLLGIFRVGCNPIPEKSCDFLHQSKTAQRLSKMGLKVSQQRNRYFNTTRSTNNNYKKPRR